MITDERKGNGDIDEQNSEAQIIEWLSQLDGCRKVKHVARDFGVSKQTIMLEREIWQHGCQRGPIAAFLEPRLLALRSGIRISCHFLAPNLFHVERIGSSSNFRPYKFVQSIVPNRVVVRSHSMS